jgi:hypothetical protein
MAQDGCGLDLVRQRKVEDEGGGGEEARELLPHRGPAFGIERQPDGGGGPLGVLRGGGGIDARRSHRTHG